MSYSPRRTNIGDRHQLATGSPGRPIAIR